MTARDTGQDGTGAETGRTRKEHRSIAGLLVVPAAALVAGVMLFLRMRVEPPTLPPYAVSGVADAGETTLRPLGPTDTFHLALEPQSEVQGAVGARAFLLRGQEVLTWEPTFLVERDGTVRIDGKVATLFAGVPPGAWDIAVAVGRPETLPTKAADVLRDAGAGDAAWHLVRTRVVLGG